MHSVADKPSFPALSAVHTVAFDFDGVFTDNKVWVDQDGRESVQCDRSDGLAFDLVRAFQRRGALRAEFFILSKEPNPVVLERARKLRLHVYHGIDDKLGFMQKYIAERFPSEPDGLKGVIYLGNDLNDLPLMRRVGYSVAPADAHLYVRKAANLVLEERGGHGFVRAFIELLLGISCLSSDELDQLVTER